MIATRGTGRRMANAFPASDERPSLQRAFDADEHRARGGGLRGTRAAQFLRELGFIRDGGWIECDRMDGHAGQLGRLDADQRGADAQKMRAVIDYRFVDLLSI